MQLHLALPGLLWPAQALSDLVFDLDLPALSWLLGRGRLSHSPPQALAAWVAARCGLDGERAPLAALRLLGAEGDPGNAHWIAADPAHVDFEHGQPTLADPAALNIDAEAIAAVAVAVAPVLASVGRFNLQPSGHGYIMLSAPADLTTTPMASAIGRGAAELLPRGRDAAAWLRLANAVQMALHDLPLNRRREAAGQPAINTLIFWGAGALPTALPTPISAPYAKVGGGDTLIRGCARFAGMPWQPASDPVPTSGAALLIDERLIAPTQQFDAGLWREALLAIERERLAPLLAALRGGRLKQFTLTALGDEAVVDVVLTRRDALRFWRRPRSLVALTGGQA